MNGARLAPVAFMTEQDLIDLALQGDLDAFNTLVLQYQDLAYNAAYRIMDDPALQRMPLKKRSFLCIASSIRTAAALSKAGFCALSPTLAMTSCAGYAGAPACHWNRKR